MDIALLDKEASLALIHTLEVIAGDSHIYRKGVILGLMLAREILENGEDARKQINELKEAIIFEKAEDE